MTRTVLPKAAWERNMTGVEDGPLCALRELSPEETQQYLAAIATGASMHAAARALGIPYLAIGRRLAVDEVFAADLAVAKQMRLMALEEILIEQATVGVDEQLVHQGHKTYEYTEWTEPDEFGLREGVLESRVPSTVKKLQTSNPTLLAILKANDRQKWMERSEVLNTTPSDLPARIYNEGDREKLLGALRTRAAARIAKEDNVEDLL